MIVNEQRLRELQELILGSFEEYRGLYLKEMGTDPLSASQSYKTMWTCYINGRAKGLTVNE